MIDSTEYKESLAQEKDNRWVQAYLVRNPEIYLWFVNNVSKWRVRMWDHHAYTIDNPNWDGNNGMPFDIFMYIWEGDDGNNVA